MLTPAQKYLDLLNEPCVYKQLYSNGFQTACLAEIQCLERLETQEPVLIAVLDNGDRVALSEIYAVRSSHMKEDSRPFVTS